MTMMMAVMNDVDDDEGSVPGLLAGWNERQEMGSYGLKESVFH